MAGKLKPAQTALLGVVGIGGAFGGYFLWQKMKQRIVTLTVSPTDIKVCETSFTTSGTVTDGLGRPIANVQVYLYLDGRKSEEYMTTDAMGNFTGNWRLTTGGTHVEQDLSATATLTAVVEDKWFSNSVTINISAPYCTKC